MAIAIPIQSSTSGAEAAVRFHGVSKTYRLGDVPVEALKSVSFGIPPQRFSMILGPSGSGKSTLLNLIGCLDRPTAGVLEIGGEKIGAKSDDELSEFRARKIGFIFQNFNLIPVLSAYENVEYPLVLLGVRPTERKRRTLEILKSVGLVEHRNHRPNQLSGGQKQRVAIARALVKGPTLVLADEPTANLDSQTGAAIIDLMRQVQHEHGATFVFSTHDPQLISHAEEVFSIRDGELLEHRTAHS
ncbi:ABC transporter ATP-binding protein [Rhodanobacter sp. OK091]|uniref:ABC transporter ATP-binding protein n=1 Tax=Rhodanobacter sp. OK091 TaxID=1881037 RepID=UPI00091D48F8|nr:ABC transporter ATP-binding protein [Rhodanobacter sp. OK091]SHL74715.1 putative ABC transport system ATP-binding protein [Rhodanobacter sp. OK091]